MEKDEIKEAVIEALNEKMTEFWIDRDVHYQHHKFISDLIEWSDKFKSTIFSTIVKAMVVSIIALILFGFIFWGREHLR